MSQEDEFYYLKWGQAQYWKLVPYNPSTNVPIMYTAASLCAYCGFATTFETLKAPFFQREEVLQFPGRRGTIDKPNLVPEEFVA